MLQSLVDLKFESCDLSHGDWSMIMLKAEFYFDELSKLKYDYCHPWCRAGFTNVVPWARTYEGPLQRTWGFSESNDIADINVHPTSSNKPGDTVNNYIT